ncbi:MAG: nucleotidyltransferase family protein [Sphingobium sp.]
MEAYEIDGPQAALRRIVLASPLFGSILGRWDSIRLPDCWLSGSAIAQTAWNAAHGLASDHGLADIDLIYFDPDDLSPDGEARQAARIRALLDDLPVPVDVKNEARVHLWYAEKFGYSIAPYRSSEHAVTTFPTTAGAVAIRPGAAGLSIFAPFGLSDLLGGIVRPNKAQITRAIYEAKVRRWRGCWPGLTIIDWQDAGDPAASAAAGPASGR